MFGSAEAAEGVQAEVWLYVKSGRVCKFLEKTPNQCWRVTKEDFDIAGDVQQIWRNVVFNVTGRGRSTVTITAQPFNSSEWKALQWKLDQYNNE